MGRVYKRGKVWWIQYYRRGELFRESSRSELKTVASSLLKKREGDIVDGRLPSLQAEKTVFEDLVRFYLQDLEINRKNALVRARSTVSHLAKSFAGLKATEITSSRINEYILKRKKQKAANGTINRELGSLKRMFRLATQQTPPAVPYTPAIPHLQEDNIRKGFFTEEEYWVMRGALPDYLKIPFIIGYWTGMRAGEILNLRWELVNLEEGWLRLEPGTTKSGRGRIVPLVKEVQETLTQWRRKTLLRYPACPWVCHYRGERLKRIAKRTWRQSCDRVGLSGKLFHDLRRTAVRKMVRSGISERVAMEISGHRTRSVFDRYNIVSENDLFDAVARLERKDASSMSTISSTIDNSDSAANLTTH